MYTIHADGELLFSTLSENVESIVLSPKVTLDINKAGSLSLVLPPGNNLHGSLKKLKSILTVEQDGEQIFRSRVMESEGDNYNQQEIYCEGERAFLLDSVHAPYSYSGTAKGLFIKFVENHNSMVDAEKRFVVGEITAVSDSETTEVENEYYSPTADEIEYRLLSVYGGYLRTRTVAGIHYLDWVKQYGDENAQPIEFGVNLLDLTDKADAGDVFTVLIPLGISEIDENGEYTEPLSIASVNGGLNYIQDDEAVALYGKIWRTRTWSYEDDPAQLLEKAREYLKTGIALETITLKAIDMHFTDGNVQPIRIGDRVRILSTPHGLDKVMVCSQIEIDLVNPENTLYTFGEKPRTLTENVVMAEDELSELTGYGGFGGGGRKPVQEELGDIIRWAKINVDEAMAHIELNTGEINKLTGQVTQAGIDIDGLKAQVLLFASKTTVEELSGRLTSAESHIALNAGNIELKASQTELDGVEARVSEAEIQIDGINSQITLKADKIDLQGYVTASQLETTDAKITNLMNGYTAALVLETNLLNAQQANVTYLNANAFNLSDISVRFKTVTMGDVVSSRVLGAYDEAGDTSISLQHSHAVTVNETTGQVQLGEVSATGGNFNIADTQFFKDAVAAAQGSGDITLTAAGWISNGENIVTAKTSKQTKTLAVKLPTFSVSGGTSWSSENKTTVNFSTASVNVPLKSLVVDASSIYTKGYDAGYAKGLDLGYDDGYEDGVGVGYDNGYAAGYQAAKNDCTVHYSDYTIRNTAANTFFSSVKISARIGGSTVASATASTSQQINVGQ